VEVHPQVSFARLAGSPLPEGKRTWAGAQHRRHLLADAGVVLADDVGQAGRHAAVDDVLDAGAAA
jgi:predicted RNase H-like nuclease